MRNIPLFNLNIRIFYKILSVSHNIVMDLNNVLLGFFSPIKGSHQSDILGNLNINISIYK
jgi:hypothetical protein